MALKHERSKFKFTPEPDPVFWDKNSNSQIKLKPGDTLFVKDGYKSLQECTYLQPESTNKIQYWVRPKDTPKQVTLVFRSHVKGVNQARP